MDKTSWNLEVVGNCDVGHKVQQKTMNNKKRLDLPPVTVCPDSLPTQYLSNNTCFTSRLSGFTVR